MAAAAARRHTPNTNETTSISNYCFLLDLRVRGNNKGNRRENQTDRRQVKLVSANYVRGGWSTPRHVCVCARESATHVNSQAALPKVKERTHLSSLIYQSADRTLRKSVFWEVRAAGNHASLRFKYYYMWEEHIVMMSTVTGRGKFIFDMPTAARFSHRVPVSIGVLCRKWVRVEYSAKNAFDQPPAANNLLLGRNTTFLLRKAFECNLSKKMWSFQNLEVQFISIEPLIF